MLSAGTASASSRKPLCGVFRHVLFPQMFSVGRAVRSPRSHPEEIYGDSRGSKCFDGTSNRSPKGIGETPQCVKDEGRLKPPFAGNVDIPLAGARRLTSRPRKRSVFPKRVNAPTIISDYFAVYRFCVINNIFLRWKE